MNNPMLQHWVNLGQRQPPARLSPDSSFSGVHGWSVKKSVRRRSAARRQGQDDAIGSRAGYPIRDFRAWPERSLITFVAKENHGPCSFHPTPRHPRRSGDPEPFFCSGTVTKTGELQAGIQGASKHESLSKWHWIPPRPEQRETLKSLWRQRPGQLAIGGAAMYPWMVRYFLSTGRVRNGSIQRRPAHAAFGGQPAIIRKTFTKLGGRRDPEPRG